MYLHPFPTYWDLSILGSRPWTFWNTWRHRSRDHFFPNPSYPFANCCRCKVLH